jgi:hypothetical protein
MPLAVMAACWWHRDLRPRDGWGPLAVGVGLGLLGGGSWALHQGLVHGWDGMREHYFKEVGNRSLHASRLSDYVLEYPKILLREFQPIVLGGLAGAVMALRRERRVQKPGAVLLALWILVWLGVANLSSARISRYVYPTLIPMALLAGSLLWSWLPQVSRVLARKIVPGVLVAGAIVFWVAPQWLGRDVDAAFKSEATTLQTALPAGTSIPLLGKPAWRLASPLLYYGHQKVGPTGTDIQAMVSAARRLPRPLLLIEKSRREALTREGIAARTVATLRHWELVELNDVR